VSRRGDKTRDAILDAAADLLERHGPARVTMADVAKRAGLTRQALYLHYPNRTTLLLSVIDHLGRERGVESFRVAPEAVTAREALRFAISTWTRYFGKVHQVALALDLARHTDEAASAAWEDRAAQRRRGIKRLVGRLAAEGELADGWTIAAASEAIAALCSPRTYTELVIERGLSANAYERFLLTAVSGFLK
jgi:AcrR family transcriptional regulator